MKRICSSCPLYYLLFSSVLQLTFPTRWHPKPFASITCYIVPAIRGKLDTLAEAPQRQDENHIGLVIHNCGSPVSLFQGCGIVSVYLVTLYMLQSDYVPY
jgi:hypothetical protein